MQRKNYSDFGKALTVIKIANPKYVLDIDYSRSKIGGIIGSTINSDNDGKFFAVKFKRVDFKTTQYLKFKNNQNVSEIQLDNHAYDLMYQLINVDGFQSDPKIWKSYTTQSKSISYCDISFDLDFKEILEKDSASYPNLITRIPRIVVSHQDISYDVFLQYTKVICSAISFFQGHETTYEKVIFNKKDVVWNSYSPKPTKNKLLTRNLGRFNIKDSLFQFLSEMTCEILGKSDFLHQNVILFNQGIYAEGTTEFMLYFTVIEKLRNHFFPPNKSKEKFTFKEKKSANNFIREKLSEIQERVIDKEKELWESVKEDKLVNLKYLPQKDQFNTFFELIKLNPSDFELIWQKVVSLRGRIFHGEYIPSDETELIELNVKMRTFVGNVLHIFFTQNLNE